MTKQILSRRTVLRQSVGLPLGGLLLVSGVSAAANAAETVCADPKKLDSGQKSIRDSLHYVEASKDPTKICGGCGFFKSPASGCGACDIFQGIVNEKGHCDSWSPKG